MSRDAGRWYIVRGGRVTGWARTKAAANETAGPRAYVVLASTRAAALASARADRYA